MLKKKIKLQENISLKSLKRKLTLPSIIAISIAGMLGSGIFVLPGIAASKTGDSVWIAYLCAAICIIPAVLSKSELATSMPKTGGAYVYIERAFGPLLGTISGLGLWISLLLKSSFALVGVSAYLVILTKTDNINPIYISIFFLFLIMLLNILGVKKVGKVQLFIVSISILGLCSLFLLGIPQTSSNEISQSFFLKGTSGLISCIAFVYISYAGVTKIAAIAGEVKNPNQNLPLAMIFSLIFVAIIYTTISYTLVTNIPVEILKEDLRPIYTLAQLLGGEWFAYAIGTIGVITLISMANSGVLASSRFPFAMAVDKLLPQQLTNIHKKYLTPINTIILTCIVMGIVIALLDVEKIAKLASAFKVLMFIAVNLCVIIFRETGVQWYNPTYKSPLYPYIQLFGIITGIILLFYLGLMPILVVIAISILGTIIYLVYGKKASRSGVLINYGHIPALFLFFRKKYQKNQSRIIKLKSKEKDGFWETSKNNNVIVSLLGNEKSPELLTEIGMSLSQYNKIDVVNITELPEQTSLELEQINPINPKIKSIKRKIEYLSNKHKISMNFHPLTTHNVTESIQVMSTYTKSKWLILEWNGKSSNGILINNPLGWIVGNIQSNFALFKDNGIKYFSKILLAIRKDSQDFEALIKIASNISTFYNTNFSIICVVSDNYSVKEKQELKLSLKQKISEKSLIDKVMIETSKNPSLFISNMTSEYDLLILGTPKKDSWKKLLFGTGKDPIASQANSSVLRITIKQTVS